MSVSSELITVISLLGCLLAAYYIPSCNAAVNVGISWSLLIWPLFLRHEQNAAFQFVADFLGAWIITLFAHWILSWLRARKENSLLDSSSEIDQTLD